MAVGALVIRRTGKVLVAGGTDSAVSPVESRELLDPVTLGVMAVAYPVTGRMRGLATASGDAGTDGGKPEGGGGGKPDGGK